MDAQRQLTSAIIPGELLEAAYLVGKIPFRISSLDNRVSYTVYIPPTAYRNVHEHLQDSAQSSSGISPRRLHLIANIHGTRRDVSMFRDSLIPFADTHGVAILAPLFPAGLDGPLDLDSCKLLRSRTLKADLVLLDIVREVANIWPGIATDKIILNGFSGGAQFVHRFTYIWPERLHAVAIGAPGSTTLLDGQLQWPAGVANVSEVFEGRAVDVDAIRRIRSVMMYVGEDDIEPPVNEKLRNWMRQNLPAPKYASETSQRSRVEGMRLLRENWRANGVAVDFVLVPAAAHESIRMIPSLETWLAKQVAVEQIAK